MTGILRWARARWGNNAAASKPAVNSRRLIVAPTGMLANERLAAKHKLVCAHRHIPAFTQSIVEGSECRLANNLTPRSKSRRRPDRRGLLQRLPSDRGRLLLQGRLRVSRPGRLRGRSLRALLL